MFKTKIGEFDGNSWESFCQQCFHLKYEDEGYQSMPAINGDYGIEGFTRDGKAFQCYCPDNSNIDTDTLYEYQRNKITKDLGKLVTYEKQLKDYIAENTIKQWIFVTPIYSKKDLVKHCITKAAEYKKLNLSILNANFDVLIHDLDNFAKEIPVVLDYLNRGIDFAPDNIDDSQQLQWKNTSISLVDNANRKNKMLLSNASEQKIDTLTNLTVKRKMDGDSIVNYWRNSYAEDYEKFLRVVGIIEKEVIIECINPTTNNMKRYKDFETLVYTKLKATFSNLAEPMLLSVRDKVIADWILNCPINFE
ncbi:hypothetical protein EZS27_013061 [termite gut metagenome]|jgi:hypothetical protein|uniref:Uncharacterized protein n=1 Tax=termite gut metagenome TaxID=433724 RepID=A0A5J4S148_9ZZZZ